MMMQKTRESLEPLKVDMCSQDMAIVSLNLCPWRVTNSRVTIFSLRKRRTGSVKVITSANVQVFAQNEVKKKVKPFTSAGRSLSKNFPKFLCKNDLTRFQCSKCRKGEHLSIF